MDLRILDRTEQNMNVDYNEFLAILFALKIITINHFSIKYYLLMTIIGIILGLIVRCQDY